MKLDMVRGHLADMKKAETKLADALAELQENLEDTSSSQESEEKEVEEGSSLA
jgi:hypothetical protein